jgi:hypothetical protein
MKVEGVNPIGIGKKSMAPNSVKREVTQNQREIVCTCE